MSIVQYTNGEVIFRAQARAASGDRNKLTLEDVQLTHRGWAETGAISVKARRALVEPATGAMQVEGGVMAQDSFGRKLLTERAEYIMGPSGSLLVHVPAPITVESREVQARAKGIDGDPQSGEFRVHGPVEGSYTP